MTKEECLRALKRLTHELLRGLECRIWSEEHGRYVLRGKFKKKYDTLEKLIEEHFNNPPLTLEDIKVGMWVWDSVYNHYTKVVGFYSETCLIFRLGLKVEYEPNRFYKMEVIK